MLANFQRLSIFAAPVTIRCGKKVNKEKIFNIRDVLDN